MRQQSSANPEGRPDDDAEREAEEGGAECRFNMRPDLAEPPPSGKSF